MESKRVGGQGEMVCLGGAGEGDGEGGVFGG